MDTGTGTLTINSSGGVHLGVADILSGGLVVTGSGDVWSNALRMSNVSNVTTGSGRDTLTFVDLDADASVKTNAGDDTIKLSGNTSLGMSVTINGGEGWDTLSVGDNNLDLNNGRSFVLENIESIKIANGVTDLVVGG